jgi:membrane protein YdbS with pleckstrin-like domain
MSRFLEWLASLLVWLVAMDAMAWLLGVNTWNAVAIGFAGVVVEEVLSMIRVRARQ